MHSEKRLKKKNTIGAGMVLFFGTVFLTLVIIAILIAVPDKADVAIDNIYRYITNELGIFYIVIYIATLFFSIWLSFSRYGDIRMGKSEEEYRDFDWAIMIICTGLAGSLMVFGITEPLNFLTDPPFDVEAMSNRAYEYAHMCGQYYWGISYWALCVPVAVYMGYKTYIKKTHSARLGLNLADDGIGNKVSAFVIDALGILAILGGVSTSMILATPLVSQIVCKITGIDDGIEITGFILAAWLVIFSASVLKGLDGGIRRLSRLNVAVFLLLLIFIIFYVSPTTIIKWEVNSIGLYISEFFSMTFYTDPIGSNGFPQRWSVFYYAYDMTYVLIIGIFIARISRGKTLKKIILGTVGYGTLGALCGFSILSCFSLELQRNGIADLLGLMQNDGNEAAVIGALETLPFSGIVMIIYALLSIFFMATTTDSTVYVLSMLTTDSNMENGQNRRMSRIVWIVIIAALTFSFLRLQNAKTMRTISMVVAFPMIIVQMLVMVSMIKQLKEKTYESKDAI